MAALTIQTTLCTGLNVGFAAASAGGDTFINDGKTILHIKNTDTVSHTVTADRLQLSSTGRDDNETCTVPAAGERIMGPFPTNRFNSSAGAVSLTYDAVVGVTIAAIKLGTTL